MRVQKVNLTEKFALFRDPFQPRVVAGLNDHEVKVVKVRGEFVWHKHEREDELFLVVTGRLTIRFRDGDQVLGPGELLVVPRGVEHMPLADEETEVVLIEPGTTVNTGDIVNERTVTKPERI